MNIHFVVSAHTEGSRVLSVKDARSLHIKAGEPVGLPCEGPTCTVCSGILGPPKCSIETFDALNIPKSYKAYPIESTRNGKKVKVKYVDSEEPAPEIVPEPVPAPTGTDTEIEKWIEEMINNG